LTTFPIWKIFGDGGIWIPSGPDLNEFFFSSVFLQSLFPGLVLRYSMVHKKITSKLRFQMINFKIEGAISQEKEDIPM
jgi:hypothetical protein